MSQIVLSRNTFAYRTKKRSFYSKFEIKSFLVVVTMGVFACVMSLMILINFNKVSTKGYTIKYLEVQQQSLWDQNEQIKRDILDLKSLSTISLTDKAGTMVRPGHIEYVSPYSTIAQK